MSKFIQEVFKQDEPVIEPTGDRLGTMLALESATTEVVESFHQVEMAEYRQEELESAHTSLEGIAASIEAMVAEDERGLDRAAAQGYALAVKAVVGDVIEQPIASLESFGGDSERTEATQISLEGLKETIKQIWEGIKRAIESAIKAVSDFITKLFGGVKKMEDRLGQLKQEIEAAKKADQKAEGKVSIGNADKLALGGKFDSKVMMEGISLVRSSVVSTADDLTEAGTSYYNGVVKGFQAKAEKPDGFFEVDGDLVKDLSKIKVVGSELPGGKSLHVDVKAMGTGPDESLNLSEAVALKDHPRARDYKGDGEIDVPSLDDLEKMRAGLEQVVKSLSDSKAKREALKDARVKVKEAADKWVKDVAGDDKIQEAWGKAKINMALRRANVDMASTVVKQDNYVYSYARTVMAGISKSLDAYAAKKEDDK